jgi:DNA-binding transcriptional LysR family regulator
LLVEQSVRAALAELSLTRERLAQTGPVLRIGFILEVRLLVESALRAHAKTRGAPEFDVRLQELHSHVQARALTRQQLDIAICYETSELANRDGLQQSLVTEDPFALVVPERAWVNGKLSTKVLATLLHARLLERLSTEFASAAEGWFDKNDLHPERTTECEQGSEILAYAGAGYGYGFLPAFWSMTSHPGAVFVPLGDFGTTVKIAAYSLQHVTPHVTRLREDLCAAARVALRDFRRQ